MYNGNSRFNKLDNGAITEEVATQTQLFFDPSTEQTRAIFNYASFIDVPRRSKPRSTRKRPKFQA